MNRELAKKKAQSRDCHCVKGKDRDNNCDEVIDEIFDWHESEVKKLSIHSVMCWVSVKEAIPKKDGQYCTYLQTRVYDSIGFTQFLDGEFMSSFVTHWMEVVKPCT